MHRQPRAMATKARRDGKNNGGRGRLPLPWPRAARLAALTAVAAFAITLPAQAVATVAGPVAIPLLLAIVGLAVVSDMIGVAATRAAETPFVARSAKRRPGAREGLDLVRHADLVATVASDVVGDLAGTVSGAMLAVVVLRVSGPSAPLVLRTALGVAVLTGVTIGAKALAKAYAVRHAEEIVQGTGRALHLAKRLAPRRRRPRPRGS
jgi:CBS domain containing-hemolysin-like protein